MAWWAMASCSIIMRAMGLRGSGGLKQLLQIQPATVRIHRLLEDS